MVIRILLLAFNVAIIAFFGYRIGRQKAYDELLRKYRMAVELLGKSEQMREAWKMKCKIEEEKNKQRKEAGND